MTSRDYFGMLMQQGSHSWVQQCFKDTVHVGLISHTTPQYLLALLDQQ